MIRTEVLVLGGGLSGLSFAHHYRELSGRDCLVLEQDGRPGGTAGTVDSDGFKFDHTGHLLHLHDPYGKKFILGLLKGNTALHERSAWIYSHRTFTRYPFQANTYGLPPKVVEDCVVGALRAQRAPDRPPRSWESFRDFCLRTFGAGVSRHFMFPYNEKLWRIDLKRLGTEWQGRFIPRPKPEEVIYGALVDQKKFFGYNAHFRYPIRGGTQALPDSLARGVRGLRLRSRVTHVDLSSKVAVAEGFGEVRYERLVNTIPLKHFLRLCEGLPGPVKESAGRLRYNSVHNLNIGIGRPRISDKHWVYFPEKEFIFYRAGFCSNFSPNVAPKGASSMYIEIARRPDEPFDESRAEKACLDGLRRAGILKASDSLRTRLWIPIECAYVVYDRARAPALARIMPYLKSRGVESIGRYGAWKYSFMEEAVLDGKRCAERMLGVAPARENAPSGQLSALK